MSLAPDAAGCAVDIDVVIPDAEAQREGDIRALVAASLVRLAERTAAAGTPLG